ncbi:hypothetical protein DRN93_02230 [archaeon]|nr:MAG: hypothetical protein DRN93_02230 [archaeon]
MSKMSIGRLLLLILSVLDIALGGVYKGTHFILIGIIGVTIVAIDLLKGLGKEFKKIAIIIVLPNIAGGIAALYSSLTWMQSIGLTPIVISVILIFFPIIVGFSLIKE